MTERMGTEAMKTNNIGYLIKEGIRGIFLHGFMSFAAICVTVACLLIVGSFSSLMYNVNIMVEDLNKTNEVLVYIDSALPEAEARSVGTQINKIANVQNAVFVPREEALKSFIEEHQGDEAFSGVQASDLRHRFVVTLMDNALIEETVASISAISGVAKINAAYELAEGFSTLQNVLHVASIAVIGILLIVSLLIISNTVKLAMYDRRDEISIMKMVGATNGFIRLPFVVEWLMYNGVSTRLAAIDSLQLFNFVPFTQLLWPMVATFVFAGLFVGVVGSWTSIRKFMDV